ncbi:hypothetical protein LPJ66_004341 [Kickxella alabastrina]|uniref:Uncharacterized protein n=1 Tax=Kickxella alabastrina TaxID=61397 RepID=A0ACC1IJX4_9FUNG|nr:hypothetical protein LPJ66_004341 [Kickxella alabastrina]
MSTSYTFFSKGAFSPSALVYIGIVESKNNIVENNIKPDFEINVNRDGLELRHKPGTDDARVLISGKFEGLFKRSARFKDMNINTTAKRIELFLSGWSFVDENGNKFKWRIPIRRPVWYLRDDNGNIVAEFQRTTFSLGKIGTLVIHNQVPESLRPLIILTCKMAHNTVRNSEHGLFI